MTQTCREHLQTPADEMSPWLAGPPLMSAVAGKMALELLKKLNGLEGN